MGKSNGRFSVSAALLIVLATAGCTAATPDAAISASSTPTPVETVAVSEAPSTPEPVYTPASREYPLECSGASGNTVTIDSYKEGYKRAFDTCEPLPHVGTQLSAAQKAAQAIIEKVDTGDALGYASAVCAETKGYYASGDGLSGPQQTEVKAALVLCPEAPHAAALRANLAKSQTQDTQTANGTRFGEGTFQVNTEIKPGSYAITGDIENCYWARLDANGHTIANDFIPAASRVAVTIQASDYSFTSDGCGQWGPAS